MSSPVDGQGTPRRRGSQTVFPFLSLLFIAVVVGAIVKSTAGGSNHVAPPSTTAVASTTVTTMPVTTTTNALGNYVEGANNTDNWAGYDIQGAPSYHSVAGTFTIPQITTGSPSNSAVTEWVGIGGANEEGLVQAGVMEAMGPCTGGQLAAGPYSPNVFYACPWLVAGTGSGQGEPQPVLSVHIGDHVTVAIHLVKGTTWDIAMRNDTTGQSWSTNIAYNGPTSSADWIVEDPTDEATGQPGPLAPIVNSVVFSHLTVPLGAGVQTEYDQDSMGPTVATDNDVLMSATDRNTLVGLLTYGFTVSPGGSAACPTPSGLCNPFNYYS